MRNLTLKLGVVAITALAAAAAVLIWSVWRGPADPLDPRQPEPAGRTAGGGPAPGSDREGVGADGSPETGGLAVGDGEGSIGGSVLDPSGSPAGYAEVLLIAVEAGGLIPAAAPPWSPDSPSLHRRLVHNIGALLTVCLRTWAAADGRFAFSGIRAGLYRVAARTEGFRAAVSGPIEIDRDRLEGTAELRLCPGSFLRGAITGPGGTPVGDARIEVSWSGDPDGLPGARRPRDEVILEEAFSCRTGTALSDPDGRFEIAGLLGGSYDLAVTAGGYARCEVADAPTGEVALRIALRPELFLRGKVVDAGSQPVAGAEVLAVRIAAEASDLAAPAGDREASPVAGPGRGTHTGGDGRFAIGGLAAGAYRVEADAPGYQRSTVPLIALHESAGGEDLVFRLEMGHGIRGSVRGPDGEPITGAVVWARYLRPVPSENAEGEGAAETASRTGPVDRDARSARTSADGTFEIAGLPPGLHRLQVSSESRRGRTIDDVPADGEPLEIELALAVPVEVIVVDGSSKAPVAGAEVNHRPAEERGDPGGAVPGTDREAMEGEGQPGILHTDREGKVRIDGLPEGLRIVRVEAEGYQPMETPPIDGDGGGSWTLALDRAGGVSGRVRSESGAPVEGLRAALMREEPSPAPAGDGAPGAGAGPGGGDLPKGPTTLTDVDGAYRLLIPESGSYRVVVEGRTYIRETSRIIEIPDPRKEVEGIDIAVRLGATVRGWVTDAFGIPVAGAGIRVVTVPDLGRAGREAAAAAGAESAPPPVEIAAARTDALGAVEISGLREGRVRLVASAPGFIRVWSEILELAFGSVHAVEMALEPEVAIAGKVTSADGEPVPGAEVRATVRGEVSRETWSEEVTLSTTPGTFRLGKLAGRRYDLRATAKGFASTLVEDVAGGAADVDVRLERPVTLSGTVVGAFTGTPAAAFRLRIEPAAPDRLSTAERASAGQWREFPDSAAWRRERTNSSPLSAGPPTAPPPRSGRLSRSAILSGS